ncbi:hypothetical protein QRD89_15360 [Halobacillus sp. ACCC02827]|uniref:hypothetical protein n=1 Tax=Halobacillus sp. ACCC02827 TaxID=3052090 RepID=UPI00257027C8|nr:hypothetical protein [Halobacillus sp. ACCC02827]WJE15083.1 hypothetical protein QRD89_15360 [Halobacillus sp. ACCC02827]
MFWISFFLVLIGLLLCGTGLSVAKKGKTAFIAGYHTTFHPKDEPKLAKRFGFLLCLFGVETMVFPLLYSLGWMEGTHYAMLAVLNIMLALFFLAMDQWGSGSGGES